MVRQANILDPIHAELDPLVWDNPTSDKPVLKPVHAHWIKSRVYKTLEDAGYTDVEQWLTLVLTGSLTTYQYSADSDADISLFVDTKVFPEWSRAEIIALMVSQLDGTVLPGTPHPLQDFVVGAGIKPSDLYKPGLRSGYNLDNDKWIVPPEKDRAHDVKSNEGGFYAWALQMADKMERLLRYEPDQAIAFWHSIHKKRQRDMAKGKGDFSSSNIIYKMLANRGLFPEISQVSGEYIAKAANAFDLEPEPPTIGYRFHAPGLEDDVRQHGFQGDDPGINPLGRGVYFYDYDPRTPPEHIEFPNRPLGGRNLYQIDLRGLEDELQPDYELEGAWHHPGPIPPGRITHIGKVAASDWFAPSYMLPDDAKQQIHEWAQTLPWPEGSRFASPERYHVTGIYSPSGFSNPSHHEWMQSHSGLTYPVQTVGVDNFTPSKVGEGAPVVLRVHHPQLEGDTERLIDEAQERGLPVSRFPGGYKPHITVGHSPSPIEAEHPNLSFPVGPLRELHSYYDELKRTAKKAPQPPNYKAGGMGKYCSNCKMYDHGECWGYGNKKVKAEWVCDSWAEGHSSRTAAPYDRQAAKFVYDPATNRLLMGQMGREEGGELTHNQLLEHPMWGDWSDRNRAEMAFGTVAQDGYGSVLSRTRLAPGKDGMNPYQKQYQTERALQRAIPGVRFTNPTAMLKPEWELPNDPEITYTGEPPVIEPAQTDDRRWDFQASIDIGQVAQRIYDKAVEGVGSTINLHGESPHTRYGFAPDLATQTPFPLETFTAADIEAFIQRFSDRLRDPEKFVGSWIQGDQVILDVTEGHDDFDTAYQRAWAGHQKSLWDSHINDEVPVRGLDYEQPLA